MKSRFILFAVLALQRPIAHRGRSPESADHRRPAEAEDDRRQPNLARRARGCVRRCRGRLRARRVCHEPLDRTGGRTAVSADARPEIRQRLPLVARQPVARVSQQPRRRQGADLRDPPGRRRGDPAHEHRIRRHQPRVVARRHKHRLHRRRARDEGAEGSEGAPRRLHGRSPRVFVRPPLHARRRGGDESARRRHRAHLRPRLQRRGLRLVAGRHAGSPSRPR